MTTYHAPWPMQTPQWNTSMCVMIPVASPTLPLHYAYISMASPLDSTHWTLRVLANPASMLETVPEIHKIPATLPQWTLNHNTRVIWVRMGATYHCVYGHHGHSQDRCAPTTWM